MLSESFSSRVRLKLSVNKTVAEEVADVDSEAHLCLVDNYSLGFVCFLKLLIDQTVFVVT